MAGASSSAVNKVCFHCKSHSDKFFAGWHLRHGGFAMLCHRCGLQIEQLVCDKQFKKAGNKESKEHSLMIIDPMEGRDAFHDYSSAYEDGTFCKIFHPEASGWRDCASCKKRIHCGCIMASHTYTILDFGGVKCAECSINEALAPNRCPPMFCRPKAMEHARDSPQRLTIDSEKALTEKELVIYVVCSKKKKLNPALPGISSVVDQIPLLDTVVCKVAPNTVATPTAPGAILQAQPCLAETGEESSVNSPDETIQSHQKNGGKRTKNVYKQSQVQSRYLPKTTPEELSEIWKVSKSSVIPLFTKELTASDVDIRNGRLVLPKRCAEAYFPQISGQQGIFLMVQDIRGKDWELYYRYWSNSNGKMYVLEGLKDYIILMDWQAGDTVTFYKREADGKFFIGFRKYQAPNPDPRVDSRASERCFSPSMDKKGVSLVCLRGITST